MAAGMVVVGAGEAGTRAATTLREEGWTGPVTLIGNESHAPYERPPLSKAVQTDEQEPAPAWIRTSDALAGLGIEHLPGVTVTEVDRAGHAVVLDDGRRLPYERLLLATGAAPRQLPWAAAGAHHYIRDYGDAVTLRGALVPGARVAVVGGGFLGLELAASAQARGCRVTVVEMAGRVLERIVPAEIAAVIADRHEDAGVELRCGERVEAVAARGGAWALRLGGGDVFDADAVVVAVGATPRTALAEEAGLEVDGGVVVDSCLATSDPDIYAAGDCCSFPHGLYGARRMRLEAWRPAQEQGAVAARNLLGATEVFEAVPWFWTDQYELTLQIAGLPTLAAAHVARRRADGVAILFGIGAEGRLLSASGIGRGNVVAKDIRLAQELIARRATPAPADLADPGVGLRTLLPGR